jgi:hypothetical protein
MLELVGQQNGPCVRLAAAELKVDQQFLLEAVALDGRVLQHCSAELLADRPFVEAAIRANGAAFEHLDPRLQDLALARVAVTSLAEALAKASPKNSGG